MSIRIFAAAGRAFLLGSLTSLIGLASPAAGHAQTLAAGFSGNFSLSLAGSSIGDVTQMAFAPGDNSHIYVSTYGQGILRYDYSPAFGLSNGVTVVPTATTNQSGANGSLGIAFSQDATLGTVMYIAPTLAFTSVGNVQNQSIVRLTDTNHDGTWGGAGDVNQAIVNNLQLGGIHWIDNLQVVNNSLYLSIGTRTQNGGITTSQGNQANPGETEYSGTVSFIQDLTKLSGDTTTPNLAGFTISNVKTDTQAFTSTDTGKLRVYATGLRNPFGLAVDDSGNLWVSMNQNEGPLLPDELHETHYQADHGFAKQNDQVGDWKAGVSAGESQAAIAAGYFAPQNSVTPTALLGNDSAAGGLAFIPQTVLPANLRGDALIARWNKNDVVITDPSSGLTQSFVTGLTNPLDVVRDPFGNMLIGEETTNGNIYRVAPNLIATANTVWGGATNSNWSTPGNWSTTAVPGASDTAAFNSAGAGHTTIATGSATVAAVLFDTGATSYNLTGGTLTLASSGSVTINPTVSSNQTISSALVLGTAAAGTYNFNNNSATVGHTLTLGSIAGGIGGTAGAIVATFGGPGNILVTGGVGNGGAASLGITKGGPGTLTLAASSTMTGPILEEGGVMTVAATGALTNVGNINVINHGTLTISGPVTLASHAAFGVGSGTTGTLGTVVVNAGGTLNIGAGAGLTFIGGDFVADSGTGRNSLFGAGTLTVNGGVVNVGAPGTVTNGTGGLDAIRVWFNPYGNYAGETSSLNLNGGVFSTQRELMDGSGGSSVVSFNGGTLQAAVTDTSGSFLGVNQTLVRNGGGTIDTQNFNITLNQALLHSTVAGDNAVDGGITKLGSGILTLNAGNTFTGNLVISQGTLIDPISENTATPTVSGLGNMTIAGRQIQVNAGATLQFTISDALGDANTLQNTALVVDGGTVTRGNFFLTLGNVTLKDGALLTGGNGVVPAFQSYNLKGTITVGGTSGSTITTTGTSNIGIHLGGNINFAVSPTGSATDLTVSAPLIDVINNQGPGTLTKSGAGKMTLSAANTYSGGTVVTGGSLVTTSTGTLGASTGTLTINAASGIVSSATIGNVQIIGSLAGTVASGGAGTVRVASGGSLTVNQTANTIFGGAISNSGTFIKSNSGILETDSPSMLASGSTLTVNGGKLRLNATSGGAAIDPGLTANIQTGATLELAGTVSALSSGSNRVSISNSSVAVAGGLLVSGNNQRVGNIDGTGSVVVGSGADLTANHIRQSSLSIGSGTVFTLTSSDASGQPLGSNTAAQSGLLLAPDLNSGSFAASASLAGSTTLLATPASIAPAYAASSGLSLGGPGANGGELAPVPEPSTCLLTVLAIGCIAASRALRRSH